jgi:hypothetical protein
LLTEIQEKQNKPGHNTQGYVHALVMTRVLKTQRLEIWKNRPKLSQHSTASTASWVLVSAGASQAGAAAARRSPKSAGGAKPRDTARSPATIVTVTHAKSSSHLRHLRQTIVPVLLLPLLPALGSSAERCRALRRAPRDSVHPGAPRAPGHRISADVAPILALSGSAQPSNALSDMGYYIAERSYTKVKSALLRYTLLSLS